MEDLPSTRKMPVMLAIVAAMFFSAINQTIVGPAMPHIISVLNGMEYYSWCITIYLLTSTIATALVGKLSDIYGRKPFMLIGIAVFMVGAFLCGFSVNSFEFIGFRGVQGIGAGIIMATAFTAVGDLFPARERGRWMGLMSAAFGFSSIVGPPLGGWMVDHWDWKWLFWVFLPLGFVAFAMILALFPKTERRPPEPVDYAGSLVLTLFLTALLLGFSFAGGEEGWGSPRVVWLLAAAVVLGIAFVLVEKRASSPVMPLSLFRNDIVTISNVIGFVMSAGMMGALIYMPLFVQGVEGVSPTYAGYVTMPMSICMVLISGWIGRQITRTGKYKRYAIVGMPVMIAGMLIMAFMNSVWQAALGMAVFGFGLGMGMPVFAVTVQNAVSFNQLGVATASSQLFRSLGGTIGITVMGTIMNSEMRRHLQASLGGDAAAGTGAGGQTGAAFPLDTETLLNQPELEAVRQSLPPDQLEIFDRLVGMVRDALGASLTTVFLTGAALVLLAAVLVFFLREIPLSTSRGKPEALEPVREKGAPGKG